MFDQPYGVPPHLYLSMVLSWVADVTGFRGLMQQVFGDGVNADRVC